ncbi:MAG TPA: ATP-binding protein [Solirubrobacteraceae bacterium]|nr:ATP-binding protein [Solirubrobacteraceae bacterium]
MIVGSELWLLRLMADRGLALLDADSVIIVLEDEGELRVAAAAGGHQPRVRIAPAHGSALAELYAHREGLALERPRGREGAWLVELGLEARSALTEPLELEGHAGGVVAALRSESPFKRADREALRAFTASVAQRLAAERSVEIERLRYGNEARERERARWARELHDESIQGIGALRLQLANARDLDDPVALRTAVDRALEDLGNEIDGLRHLITELRPAALDDLGLAAALEALARRAQARDGLDVRTDIDLGSSARLDAELEGNVYRILQEALTNVGRHAGASHAVIAVRVHDGVLTASVTDDGRGIDASGERREAGDVLEGGFGISGMRERADLVRGELTVRPAAGGGTTVELVVPLADRPDS